MDFQRLADTTFILAADGVCILYMYVLIVLLHVGTGHFYLICSNCINVCREYIVL